MHRIRCCIIRDCLLPFQSSFFSVFIKNLRNASIEMRKITPRLLFIPNVYRNRLCDAHRQHPAFQMNISKWKINTPVFFYDLFASVELWMAFHNEWMCRQLCVRGWACVCFKTRGKNIWFCLSAEHLINSNRELNISISRLVEDVRKMGKITDSRKCKMNDVIGSLNFWLSVMSGCWFRFESDNHFSVCKCEWNRKRRVNLDDSWVNAK